MPLALFSSTELALKAVGCKLRPDVDETDVSEQAGQAPLALLGEIDRALWNVLDL